MGSLEADHPSVAVQAALSKSNRRTVGHQESEHRGSGERPEPTEHLIARAVVKASTAPTVSAVLQARIEYDSARKSSY
jgi:hypothetical protein